MAGLESTVPAVRDDEPYESDITPLGGFNEDPESHNNSFELAIMVCVEGCPIKTTPYDLKDLFPAAFTEI